MTSPTSPLKKRPSSSFRVPIITPTAVRGEPPEKVPVGVVGVQKPTFLRHRIQQKRGKTQQHVATAGAKGAWNVGSGARREGIYIAIRSCSTVTKTECPTADHLRHFYCHWYCSCGCCAAAVLLLPRQARSRTTVIARCHREVCFAGRTVPVDQVTRKAAAPTATTSANRHNRRVRPAAERPGKCRRRGICS
jgi:hypothetical protein